MKKANKILLGSLIIGLAGGITACGPTTQEISDPYILPDLYNMELGAARLQVGTNVLFDVVEVPTSEVIEDRVLGYGDDYEVGDTIQKGTRIKLEVGVRPEDAKNYDNEVVKYSSYIEKTTGPESVNADILTAAGQSGTDLGIPFELPDGRVMLLYGDTFSAPNMGGMWRSNFMAITSDKDLTDGLNFDSVVTNDIGALQPFAQGAHQNGSEENIGTEVTKIPTGGISIGNDVYMFYMSIRYWGVAGSWLVTYNQCLKATDSTYTEWVDVPSLRWKEEEFYYGGQIFPYEDPKDENHIYFISIPGGRNSGAVMFRVTKENFENRDEYEYLVAEDTWVKGDEGMSQLNEDPYFIVDPSCSEPSVMYSEYLDKYMVCTAKGSGISILLADEITGPYDDLYTVIEGSDYPGMYGGFATHLFQDSDGQRIYLQLSQRTPIYNTSLIEVVFQ